MKSLADCPLVNAASLGEREQRPFRRSIAAVSLLHVALETLRQIREKIRTAPDSEVPELCNELFQASHREYVVDTAHLKRSRQDPCAYPVAGLRNAQFVFQSGLASLGEWDFRSDMKKVKVPALVLEGAETHVPLSEAREWVKSLPDARFLLIPDAGHAIFIDQPEAVISAMDEFFRGKWPAGAK